MTNKQNALEEVAHIRQMMERSSRFISLSGWSGVVAGVLAIVGLLYLDSLKYNVTPTFEADYTNANTQTLATTNTLDLLWYFREVAIVAMLVFVISGGFAIWFTRKKAIKNNQWVLNNHNINILLNLLFPLVIGGLFAIAILPYSIGLVSSVTLIFYGLALVNGSKYTLPDIGKLGALICICGVIDAFSDNHLLMCIIGFGVLHIVYGLFMHFKYK
jgi:hypothetical protein